MKQFLLLLTSLLFVGQNFAQTPAATHHHTSQLSSYQSEIGPTGVSRCATVETEAWRRAQYPDLPSPEEFEEWLAPKVRQYKEEIANGTRTSAVITIPIVVHVLHNGEPMGSAPNISDAQALSQVQVMNEDFRRILNSPGYNTHPDGADLELEFAPAQTDPNGQPTNGVNHVNVGQDGVTRDDLESTIKPATIWNPNEYMNMWAVKFAAPDDNLLGYAQFPESSGLDGMPAGAQGANTDGVVIRYNSFGTINADTNGDFLLDAPYDLGRTATHEVGHWVGLRHTWGDMLGCSMGLPTTGCACSVDDFCDDTPNSDMANYRCETDKTSNCEDPLVPTQDMVENYMDYSNDVCMNIFTNDQKARAQTVMSVSPRRLELQTSIKHLAPAPYVLLVEERGEVTEGSDCSVQQDVSVDFKLSEAAGSATTVSISVDGTSTASASDYSMSSSSFSIPAGSTTGQFTFQLNEDFVDETTETLVLNFTTSGGGLTVPGRTRYTLTIRDDDHAPEVNGTAPMSLAPISTNFADWTATASSTSAVQFTTGSNPATLLSGNAAYVSLTTGGAYAYNQAQESSCMIQAPVFDATGWKNMSVTFTYVVDGELDGGVYYDYGELVYSIDGNNWTTVGTRLAQPVGSPQTSPTTVSYNLPERANNQSTLHVAMRWVNDGLVGQAKPLAFNNFSLRGDKPVPVAVAEDLTPSADERTLGPNETVHFYAPGTNEVMLTLQNNDSHDYGCTSVSIDRSATSEGTATAPFWNDNPANALISKTFSVSPTTDNPSGSITATLYFTDAEIQNWMMATGNTMAGLEVIKVKGQAVGDVNSDNGSAATVEVVSGSMSSYDGGQWKLSATTTTGFSGFAAGVAGAALPVELTALSAVTEQHGIRIAWTTATELNNDHFTVERSADGTHFEDLGRVAGAGNSDEERHYDLLDRAPLPGTNYYRLRQTDYDGSTEISKMVSAAWRASGETVVVTPNPSAGPLTVTLPEHLAEFPLRIRNAIGQVLDLRFPQTGPLRQLDLSGYPAGVYTIEVLSTEAIDPIRVVIR